MIPIEITEDLRKGMSLEDCLTKHNTNLKVLFKTNYPETIRRESETKHIEEKGGKFRVKKKKMRSTYYFGTYSCLEDAQRVRDELILIGWKQKHVDSICERLGIERLPSKNESRFH